LSVIAANSLVRPTAGSGGFFSSFALFLISSDLVFFFVCPAAVLDGPGVASVSDEAQALIDNMVAIEVGRRHDIEAVARCPWLLDEDTMASLRSTVFKDAPIF
jgi:hypothetical protein